MLKDKQWAWMWEEVWVQLSVRLWVMLVKRSASQKDIMRRNAGILNERWNSSIQQTRQEHRTLPGQGHCTQLLATLLVFAWARWMARSSVMLLAMLSVETWVTLKGSTLANG